MGLDQKSLARKLFYKGKTKRNLLFLDTMVFIYHFERNPQYFPITNYLFNSIEKGEVKAFTSIISLIEILTGPLKLKEKILAKEYNLLLSSFPNLKIIDLNQEIAEKTAELRAEFNLRTPDAIQVATALVSNSESLITNDRTFKKIKGIDILILKDLIK